MNRALLLFILLFSLAGCGKEGEIPPINLKLCWGPYEPDGHYYCGPYCWNPGDCDGGVGDSGQPDAGEPPVAE